MDAVVAEESTCTAPVPAAVHRAAIRYLTPPPKPILSPSPAGATTPHSHTHTQQTQSLHNRVLPGNWQVINKLANGDDPSIAQRETSAAMACEQNLPYHDRLIKSFTGRNRNVLPPSMHALLIYGAYQLLCFMYWLGEQGVQC